MHIQEVVDIASLLLHFSMGQGKDKKKKLVFTIVPCTLSME